ncbi:BTAD domain-containing putative transcriptional regulator [Haloechinothrix halophila]|uniref:BTAD domain-containing putative transcriptional regulator n=1 Tax=Haloechinothrix halophila TaxID=1069073 RepID=UPI0012FAE27D|nr:BTAD domain-containing putative transcriptional regulator [Haloechinothrix halophila]
MADRNVEGMRFQILGQLAVWDGDVRISIPGAKQRALLGYLLVHHGYPVPADRIIDELWGEDVPSKARNALQAKVSSLRGALAPGDPERGRALLRADEGGYRLAVPGDAVDAARFEKLVSEGRRAIDGDQLARAYGLFDEALTMWRGEPLPELHDYRYATVAAEQLTARYLTAIELHATTWLSVGGSRDLPDKLLRILAEHPLRESLRALAMRALARQGRQAEALAVYTDGRTLLAEELGVDPGAELRTAHADVLAQHPVAEGSGQGARVRLPAESTSFVGRHRDRRRLCELIERERLVTVTGPGGIGKTRLVVNTLSTMAPPADGIWFADLRGVAEHDCAIDRLTEIADTVLRTVRDRDGASLGSDERVVTDRHRAPLDRMCAGIGGRDAVLVLDNCEHISADVATLARELLVQCPGLRLVTTTRVLLGLPEEAMLRLEPLPVPPEGSGRDACLASEAVALFSARARLNAESLSDADLDRVTAIVRRTEGIPLAMEVAAGLLRGMTLKDVADHLRGDRHLLQNGNDYTLNDTIARSWGLLDPAETDLLTRLATIEGRWGLDAAYALAGTSVPHDEVATTVARLVERSLVNYDPASPLAPYRLLEAIRDYSARRLAGHPERDGIVLAHAEHFLRLTERTDPLLRGADQPEAFALLGANHPDVLTAIRTFLAAGRVENALRTATAMGWYWWLSGRRREGRAVLCDLLTRIKADGDMPLVRTARAWAGALGFTGGDAEEAVEECIDALDEIPSRQWDTGLLLVAILVADRLYLRGDPNRARRFRERIEEVAEREDDQWYTAAARFTAGMEATLHGRVPEARHFAEASHAGFVDSADLWGQAQSLDLLAGLDENAGDYPSSRRARERVIELAERLGLHDVHAYQLVRIGNLCTLTADLDAAERLLLHARDLAKQLGIASTVAYADNGLGLVLRRTGKPHQAQIRHEAALRHYRQIGSTSGIAFTSAMIGLAAGAAGNVGDAVRWQRDALHASIASGDRRAVALALEGLAVALAPSERAAVLFGAARALRAEAGTPRPAGEIPDVDRVETGLRDRLKPDVLERAALTGKSWASELDELATHVESMLDHQ